MNCPKCSYAVPNWPWQPELGESIGGLRKCPACFNLFTEDGLEYIDSPDIEEDTDMNNPGRYLTKFCNSCEKEIHIGDIKPDPRNHDGLSAICRKCHSTKESDRQKRKRKYPTYAEDLRAYERLAYIATTVSTEEVKISQGMVRIIAEMLKE